VNISIALGLAVCLATAAAITDFRTRRIPNWLTGGALALGVLLNVWQAGPMGILVALGGAALGFAILLPFYLMHTIGAGDVKLLAGLGALVGPQVLISVAVYGAVVGGVIAAVMLANRGRLMLALNELLVQRTLPSRSGMTAPYGVAIASGVYLSLVLPGLIR
jgi:prepilin peptidase CpaA